MIIKPWNSQVTQTTTLGEQLVLMQTEIDELREVLTNVCVTLERIQKERDLLILEKIKQQPEPVGYVYFETDYLSGDKHLVGAIDDQLLPIGTALYASPPPAQPVKPLTTEQIRDLAKESGLDWQRSYMPLFDGDKTNKLAVFAETIEAHHGIKDHP